MHLPPDEARRRMADSSVGYLATVRHDGRPHIVPIVFPVRGDAVYSIRPDAEGRAGPPPLPKRRGQSLRNAARPRHDEDPTQMWWIRIDGVARLVEGAPDRDLAIRLRREKYRQHETWSGALRGGDGDQHQR
jgi:predicted pyridoxine 5'-phosphate oxidase superfamily flavin-nucleotide-binding protein